VARKEQFLADNPDAVIVHDRDASPHQHWRGQVPGSDEVTSHDLEQLLDKLDDLVAARDAHTRWPRWTFSHRGFGWQAKEMNGSELVVGQILADVETRVAQCEGIAGSPAWGKMRPGAGTLSRCFLYVNSNVTLRFTKLLSRTVG
jgi:hypothetical protein